MITSVSKGVFIVLVFCLIFFFSLVLFDLFVLVQAGSNRCWKGGLLVLQNGNKKRKKKRRKKTPKSLAVGERVDEHDLFLNFLSIFFYFFLLSLF